MQKVSQLPYQRVSMEEFAQEIQGIITQVKEASSAQAVMAARDQCNQLVIRWQTAEALSYMRYSINTADPFYLAEKDYYDEVGPQAQNYLLEYTKAMLATPFRQELEESGAIIPWIPFLRGGAEIHFPGNHRGYGGGEPGWSASTPS